MAAFRTLIVRYAPLAIAQFDAISAYLKQRSPRGAQAVAGALHRTIADIANYPYLGRPGRAPGIRIKPVAGRPYVVVYEVHDERDEVAILGIFHAAQNRDDRMKWDGPMAEKKTQAKKVVADNRRARFDYEIGEVFEAGIALSGTEVKSLRGGKATVAESYVSAKTGEAILYNSFIPEYLQANRFNHEPRRPRKLLMHKREIAKLWQAVEREGMTVVPLRIYFNEQGRAKVELAIARGRKAHDKREALKEKDWARDKQRLMRDRG